MLYSTKNSYRRYIQPPCGLRPILSPNHAFHARLMTFNPYRECKQATGIRPGNQYLILPSHNIITKRHGGVLEFKSAPGKGPYLKLELPNKSILS